MGFDRFDLTALVGFLGLIGLSFVVETPALGAGFGGFLLSLAVWRLYDGKPWEALAWLAWVGAAVALAIPAGSVSTVLFISSLIVGLALLFASRRELLPAIWFADSGGTDD
ncbi:hypothetical protein ACLI4U_04950 [Natrialbaceae archaeon A-CW2]|uniref:hypothetical protein n=1 Tax=Natronosalvus amylolyticus TaxID=2961994 RepID=UPI0020C971F6|nr:hypothetical protein [Natronosalvus amylolyticus]